MANAIRSGLLHSCFALAAVAGASAASAVDMAPVAAPFGSWPSVIGADRLASSSIGLADLRTHQGHVFWRESRPDEGGRQVVMRLSPNGDLSQVTPPGFNVRSRAHEYGGASYAVLDDAIVFSNFADQRLYLQRGDAAPVAITPPGFRYADCSLHPRGDALLCVREDHTDATRAANG
jgi:hypothetical protein